MTEQTAPDRLILAGYLAPFDTGFALPCYGGAPRPNAWFMATTTIQGDHAATVSGFQPLEDPDVRHLPMDRLVEVPVGAPWRDVFLYGGEILIGTPAELLETLGADFDSLAARDPLNALDLVLAAEDRRTGALIQPARIAIEAVRGASGASQWLTDLILRPQARIEVRRRLRQAGLVDDRQRARAVQVTETEEGFTLVLPPTLADALARAGGGQSDLDIAQSLSQLFALPITGRAASPSVRILSLTIEGGRSFSSETILAASGLAIGDHVSEAVLQRARDRVFALSRFSSVLAGHDGEGHVTLTVREHPVLTDIEISGDAGADPAEVFDVLKLAAGEIFDEQRVEAAARRLADFCAARRGGRPDVRYMMEETAPGGAVLLFEIRDDLDGEGPGMGHHVLVLVSGGRARRVAAVMRRPDWTPDPTLRYDLRRGGDVAGHDDPPQLHVLPARGDLPDLSGYKAVVLLFNDDPARVETHLARLKARATLDRYDGPVLIAPVPTDDRPAELLRNPWRFHAGPMHLIMVDTAVARSPFWSGRTSWSPERRIADLVTGAALLTATRQYESAIHDIRSDFMERPDGAPVLSFARDGRYGPLALCSEVNAPNLSGGATSSFGRFEFDLFEDDGGVTHGHGYFGPPRWDFPALAEAALTLAKSAAFPPRPGPNVGSAVPGFAQALDAPELTAAFVDDVLLDLQPVLITAETPSLAVALAAEREAWVVARYTDRATLKSLRAGHRRPGAPLIALRLPKLELLSANFGLTIRGVDPRNLARGAADVWNRLDGRWTSPLRDHIRVLRDAAHPLPPEILVAPIAEVRAAAKAGDPLGNTLLELNPGRRHIDGSDRFRLFRTPSGGVDRWVIEEGGGRLFVERLGSDQLASPRLVVLDGDLAVPLIIRSRAFRIWAEALFLSSRSRTRLTTRVFDTFPLPPGVRLERDGWTGDTRLQLENPQWHDAMADMERLTGDGAPTVRAAIQDTLDAHILETYGGWGLMSDLELMDLLVTVNGARAVEEQRDFMTGRRLDVNFD